MALALFLSFFFLLLSWHRRIAGIDIVKTLLALEEGPVSNTLPSQDI